MATLLLKQAQLGTAKHKSDVLVKDGSIAEIASLINVEADTVLDADGLVMLPGLIDGHAHIDKTLWGMEWYENDVPRDLQAIVENERRFRAETPFDSQQQSERIAKEYLRLGTTHIRTHIDVDTEMGCRHVEGVLATKKKLRGLVEIETVCFPQSGMLGRPGTYDVMDQAMTMGCDLVGGIDPSSFERDPVRHIDCLFELAQKHGKGIDLHLHEAGELGAFSVELVAERVQATGMQGMVTISHAFCLGEVDDGYQRKLAALLGQNDIRIATTAPSNRTVPPFELLREHGVIISAGNDGIRDTWSPYGNADLLQRAMFLGLKYRWRKDKELEQALYAITEGGAQLMGLENYGLRPGADADFVLVKGQNFVEAIVSQPAQRTVFRKGRCVVNNGEWVGGAL